MWSHKQFTYNVDLMNNIGFVLCSPFCGILFNILVLDKPWRSLAFSARFFIALLLLVSGIGCIMRARWIARKIDARINNNNHQ